MGNLGEKKIKVYLRREIPGGKLKVYLRREIPGGTLKVYLRREIPGGTLKVYLRREMPRGGGKSPFCQRSIGGEEARAHSGAPGWRKISILSAIYRWGGSEGPH